MGTVHLSPRPRDRTRPRGKCKKREQLANCRVWTAAKSTHNTSVLTRRRVCHSFPPLGKSPLPLCAASPAAASATSLPRRPGGPDPSCGPLALEMERTGAFKLMRGKMYAPAAQRKCGVDTKLYPDTIDQMKRLR